MLILDVSRLTPIKEQLPDYVEFNHIKVVVAILKRKYGMSDTLLQDVENAHVRILLDCISF